MSIYTEQTDEMQFIRHALKVLNIQVDEDTWIHGGTWSNGKITITWGLRSITDPPCVIHPDLQFTGHYYLSRDLGERLACYRARLQNTQSIDFRDRILLTAILNFTIPESAII